MRGLEVFQSTFEDKFCRQLIPITPSLMKLFKIIETWMKNKNVRYLIRRKFIFINAKYKWNRMNYILHIRQVYIKGKFWPQSCLTCSNSSSGATEGPELRESQSISSCCSPVSLVSSRRLRPVVRRIQATASQLVKLSRRKRRKRRQQKTRQRGCRRVRGRGESWEAARVGKLKAGLV